MIAAMVPAAAAGNTLPLLTPRNGAFDQDYASSAALLVANLNAFVYDFIARQKVQGQHLNWYIVEQLPTLRPAAYERKFGKAKAKDLIRDHVLRLSYTAHDLASFARDIGYVDKETGNVLPPFKWDGEERTHLRARLDALFFLLYGIETPEEVSYVLESFPGVRADDMKTRDRYRTLDLILAYMSALKAGDTKTTVSL